MKKKYIMMNFCIVSSSIGGISTFEGYLLDVFIIGDLGKISFRVFFP